LDYRPEDSRPQKQATQIPPAGSARENKMHGETPVGASLGCNGEASAARKAQNEDGTINLNPAPVPREAGIL